MFVSLAGLFAIFKGKGKKKKVSVEWGLKFKTTPDAITSSVVYNDKLYFGVGNGLLYQWTDTGAVVVAPLFDIGAFISCLTVFNNKIYAGTTNGKLLQWNGVNAWVQVAPATHVNVYAMIVFNGKLYGCSDGLYQWNGVNAWVDVAPVIDDPTASLAVFNNKLYGGTIDNGAGGGKLLEWNGVNAWVQVAPKIGGVATNDFIWALLVYNGKLYGGTTAPAPSPRAGGGLLFEWNGVNAWVQVAGKLGGEYDNELGIISLCEYNGYLYGGTVNSIVDEYLNYGAKLFQWDGIASWIEVAHPPLGSVYSDQINTLTAFNGKLYAGTQQGYLYEFYKPATTETGAWVSPSTPSSGTTDGAATGDLGSRLRTLHRTTSLTPTIIG